MGFCGCFSNATDNAALRFFRKLWWVDLPSEPVSFVGLGRCLSMRAKEPYDMVELANTRTHALRKKNKTNEPDHASERPCRTECLNHCCHVAEKAGASSKKSLCFSFNKVTLMLSA